MVQKPYSSPSLDGNSEFIHVPYLVFGMWQRNMCRFVLVRVVFCTTTSQRAALFVLSCAWFRAGRSGLSQSKQ